MKDVAGKILSVGDLIAVTLTGRPELVLANIIGFTPKKIKIQFKSAHIYESDTPSKFPYQVVFVSRPAEDYRAPEPKVEQVKKPVLVKVYDSESKRLAWPFPEKGKSKS